MKTAGLILIAFLAIIGGMTIAWHLFAALTVSANALLRLLGSVLSIAGTIAVIALVINGLASILDRKS